MTHPTCGYTTCRHEAVAQVRQTVGQQQILPVCELHKSALLKAWANRPAKLAHLPVCQVMEPLSHRPMATNQTIEARRQKLLDARTKAIAARDWAAMNEITKRLAKLPVKGDKDYPRAS